MSQYQQPKTPREHALWNEEMARRYNPDVFITQSGYPIRRMEALRLKKTRRALEASPGDTVLDLGCGAGNLLETLPGFQIVGLDLSDYLLKQAAHRIERQANVRLIKADGQKLPFADNVFDRIICSEVMEHALNPKILLEEIHRVAKPGSRLVITLPNEELINKTKRLVLRLGLKKLIAGRYEMSDNMLHQWHLSEISPSWLKEACGGLFEWLDAWVSPCSLLPYHHIFILKISK